jgi:hypothetical protein
MKDSQSIASVKLRSPMYPVPTVQWTGSLMVTNGKRLSIEMKGDRTFCDSIECFPGLISSRTPSTGVV